MHAKIDTVALYLRARGHPFVAIQREGRVRFYDLTKSCAWRLAKTTYGMLGHHTVSGLGWSWYRHAH